VPTLDELSTSVYSDLADEAKAVFSQLQVEDFIRGGMTELNRAAPPDLMQEITLSTDDVTGRVDQFLYYINIHHPYRVEAYRLSDGWTTTLPNADTDGEGNSSNGWLWQNVGNTLGAITFPRWWLSNLSPADYGIRVYGYGARPLPDSVVPPTPSPETGLTDTEEYAVRFYAKAQGYDLLAHDRSMFAQWQGQTNNTDVSPTQIMQMAGNAKNEWDRQRGLIRVVRRY
jgi:hypothetical protein